MHASKLLGSKCPYNLEMPEEEEESQWDHTSESSSLSAFSHWI
jgi:hypothetical protein